jgi:hypothetical protein
LFPTGKASGGHRLGEPDTDVPGDGVGKLSECPSGEATLFLSFTASVVSPVRRALLVYPIDSQPLLGIGGSGKVSG